MPSTAASRRNLEIIGFAILSNVMVHAGVSRAQLQAAAHLAVVAVSVEGSGSGWWPRRPQLPANQPWWIGCVIGRFRGNCDVRQPRDHAGQLAALAAVDAFDVVL